MGSLGTVIIKIHVVYTLQTVISVLGVLLAVAYFSLFERNVLGGIQLRVGPQKVGVLGWLQPFSDAIKLISKQSPVPSDSDRAIYVMTPLAFCAASQLVWVVSRGFSEGSIIIIAIILSVSAFGPISAGWASNSTYALLGSGRAIAQAISFEIIFSLSLTTIMFVSRNSGNLFSMQEINKPFLVWGQLSIPIVCLFISLLAEAGRSPFDLPEGESELVGGYLVDFGGSLYKMIFLMENISCIFISYVMACISTPPVFWWKTCMFLIVIVWIRGTMPRVRYDQAMLACWTSILPVLISVFVLSMLMVYTPQFNL